MSSVRQTKLEVTGVRLSDTLQSSLVNAFYYVHNFLFTTCRKNNTSEKSIEFTTQLSTPRLILFFFTYRTSFRELKIYLQFRKYVVKMNLGEIITHFLKEPYSNTILVSKISIFINFLTNYDRTALKMMKLR